MDFISHQLVSNIKLTFVHLKLTKVKHFKMMLNFTLVINFKIKKNVIKIKP